MKIRDKAPRERPINQAKPKPEKRPPVPKTRDMRKVAVLQILLWVVIGFVFLRGLWAILFPPDTQQRYTELAQRIQQVDSRLIPQNEAGAFAANFARDYFTYKARDLEAYKKRLEVYCSSRLVSELCEGLILRGGATATAATAVDMTPYSSTQQDITVAVVVNYQTEQLVITDGQEVLLPTTATSLVYLVVPVYISPTGYLVEDLPLVTAAPAQATDYQHIDFSATTADDRIKASAETMLDDFLKTLFSEEQRRIDYYLTEDANRQRLREIKGVMSYDRIDSLTLYNSSTPNSYTGIVSLRLVDGSGTTIKQRFNLTLIENGSRIYVQNIGLRSHNL